jgi:hypothetical protein
MRGRGTVGASVCGVAARTAVWPPAAIGGNASNTDSDNEHSFIIDSQQIPSAGAQI